MRAGYWSASERARTHIGYRSWYERVSQSCRSCEYKFSLFASEQSATRVQQQRVCFLCRQTVIVKRLLDGYSKQDPPDQSK